MEIYPIFLAQAGCPQQCCYCSRWQVAGGGSEPLSPEAVAAWLERCLPAVGRGQVAIYGGSFTALARPQQDAYLAAVAPFLDQGRVAGVRISTRPDALDAGTARRLAAAGVTTVELGCQSFSDQVLVASGRGHDARAAGNAVAALREAGLEVGLQLMPGLPGGDAAEARASLAAALALKPDFLRIYPTLVLAGSPLAEDWRQGRYRPLALEEAVELCADLLLACHRAGVPVIRLGLQHDAALAAGVLAGPWHPAFGQLVKSRLWRRALAHLAPRQVPVELATADLSDAVGHRRGNLDYFSGRGQALVLRPDPALGRGLLRQADESFSLLRLAAQTCED